MINRRNFLGTLAVLPTVPSLFAGYKVESHLDIDSFHPMNMRLVKDNWGNIKLKITKGPYSTECYSGHQDCRDSHGICATSELVLIAKHDLELGEENQKLIWSKDWGWSPEEMEIRTKFIEGLRRIKLTKQEVIEIYDVLRKLRGPHDCYYSNMSTEKCVDNHQFLF